MTAAPIEVGGVATTVTRRSGVDLRPVFQPSSIAIVGASERVPYVVGLNRNLRKHKFGGAIYPINPGRKTIWDMPCYPNVASTPTVPELAYIAVNREQVIGLVGECAAAGIKALIVNSNGYADHPDPHGREMQNELATFVQQHGMVMVGPNCLGVYNVRGNVAVIAGLDHEPFLGKLVIVSQSGGNTLWLMEAATNRHIGVSYAVSSGNEAVLNLCDYLEYFLPDPDAGVFCFFVETIREPDRFLRLAVRAADLSKPIVIVKIGKSPAAKGAALAHTGSLVGPDEFVDALVSRAGVLRASGLDDAMDKCILFSQLSPERWPRGPRIGVFTVGGGLAGIAADIAAARGIEVPPLPATVAANLREVYPDKLTIQNPIDTPGVYAGSADRLGQPTKLTSMFVSGCLMDPNFDAVVVSAMINDPRESSAFLACVDEAVTLADKPVVFAQPIVKAMTEHWHEFVADSNVAVVTGLDRCAVALQAMVAFQDRRSDLASSFGSRKPRLAEDLRAALVSEIAAGRKVVSHSLTFQLLEAYGLPVVEQALVPDADSAVTFAAKVGYPVVVKLPNSDSMTHKTEVGGVRTNLRDASEVATAVRETQQRSKQGRQGAVSEVVVQRMVLRATEIYLGASNPGFDYPPAVLVGLGGIFLEATRDVSLSLAPIDMIEAKRMVERLRSHRILTGFRGQPPADLAAIAEAIVHLSDFVVDLEPYFHELDINPAMVLSQGLGMRVVDAVLTYRSATS